MSKKDKPGERKLPEPPRKGPFGRKRHFEGEEDRRPDLLAEHMHHAMAQGRLEEFLNQELPDNPMARKLAEMVMGTGGAHGGSGHHDRHGHKKGKKEKKEGRGEPDGEERPAGPASEELLRAASSGDVQELTRLLAREQKKRSGEEPAEGEKRKEEEERAPEAPSPEGLEKEILDSLISIAGEHGVSLDWLIARALKLYVRDYRQTGRL
jgi:hypothetical protein